LPPPRCPPPPLLSSAPFAGTQRPGETRTSPKGPQNLASKQIPPPQEPPRRVQSRPPPGAERDFWGAMRGFLYWRGCTEHPPPFPHWGVSSPFGAHGWGFFEGKKCCLGARGLRVSTRVLRKQKSFSCYFSPFSETESRPFTCWKRGEIFTWRPKLTLYSCVCSSALPGSWRN